MLWHSVCIEKNIECMTYDFHAFLCVILPVPYLRLTEMVCIQCIKCLHVFDILFRLFVYVLTRENVFLYRDRHLAFLHNFVS